MASLTGKVFILTGGASGIGLATAKILSSRGASLLLGDVNAEGLKNAAAAINSPGNIETFVLDVRDRSAVRNFVEKCQTRFGRIDGCANIAGVSGKKSLNTFSIWELDDEEYDFIMDVNTRGVFHCLAEQLKPEVLPEGASIVNVASICGLRGLPRAGAYCASKHAVLGFTKAAAIEAGPRNIRVNAVAPGMVETPMLSQALVDTKGPSIQSAAAPFTRFAKPEEIGEVIAFLLSDQSTFVTGATYSVDGGWNT